MIGLETLVYAVLYLIVGGLIFWLLDWLLGYVGVPEPFHKIARVVLAVAAVLFVISVLLWLIGFPLIRMGPPRVAAAAILCGCNPDCICTIGQPNPCKCTLLGGRCSEGCECPVQSAQCCNHR